MFNFLIKLFIKNHNDVRNTKVRERYGKLSSIIGIIINLFLSTIKFITGIVFNSISITGDAVNNLSDAGSSVISLVSFKLSGKPADQKHPFGHARIEYLASSIVAVIILFVGAELIKTSVNKIINPEPINFSIITVFVLIVSIGAKFWLNRMNTFMEKKIGSSMLKATAADSMSDVMATSAVLISSILSPIINFQLDSYMGIAVAVFIMFSGFKIMQEVLDSLLGKAPSDDLISMIEAYIRKYEGVIGIHDLVVHDYGPQRCFASVHVEVDANHNIMESHDLVDNIERDIAYDYKIHLVIHMDPIVTDDPIVYDLRQMTENTLYDIDESLTMHDFRVVKGSTHCNLIFDVVVPYQCSIADECICEEIKSKINEKDKNLYPVITLDRSYASFPNNRTK